MGLGVTVRVVRVQGLKGVVRGSGSVGFEVSCFIFGKPTIKATGKLEVFSMNPSLLGKSS